MDEVTSDSCEDNGKTVNVSVNSVEVCHSNTTTTSMPHQQCCIKQRSASDSKDISRQAKICKIVHRSQSLVQLKYRRTNPYNSIVESISNRSSYAEEGGGGGGGGDSKTEEEEEEESSKKHFGFKSYSRQQKLTLLCLALIHFGVYLSMSIMAPFFPLEAELKGMSMSVTGYVFSSYALVMFLASPFMGKVITHAGVKFTLISGIFLASGCNILFGTLDYINDYTIFASFCFVLRSVEALGAAAFFTAAWTTIADVFPDDISYVFGLMETFVGLGMSAGPALGGALYSLGGYELPFYSLGSFMMATVPVCLIILPDPQIKKDFEESASPSLLRLLRVPGILIVSLVVMVLCGIWGFLDATLEQNLSEFGVTPETTGILFLLLAATYSITCPFIGYIEDKWGYKYTMMCIGSVLTGGCLILMGPSIILPFLESDMIYNIISLLFLGITLGIGVIPTFQAMLDEAHKGGFEDNTATYGLISSIFSATSSLGEFLGPAVGGVLFENYNFDFASTCIAIAAFATAVIVAISTLFRRNKAKNAAKGSMSTASTTEIN